MKLSDYIVKELEHYGIDTAFLISGGLAMHIDDSFGQSKKITTYTNFHEQASAMAAEGYAKVTGIPAVVVVTGGPGGSNTITGIVGQWQDSVPAIYIVGQVRTELIAPSKQLRQYGEQELHLVPLVSSITKYAVEITDPATIKYHLQKALWEATTGRPGPVVLEIPLDIQAAEITPDALPSFKAPVHLDYKDDKKLNKAIDQMLTLLKKAKRPVLIAGSGIRIAQSHPSFMKLVKALQIPVVTASCANDNMYADHPLYFGNPGLIGDRASNFVIQNADFVLSIGARLNFKTISFNYKAFAREAELVVVDIDPAELQKKSISPVLKIHADAKDFITQTLLSLKKVHLPDVQPWVNQCNHWKEKFPRLLPEYEQCGKTHVNSYYFVHTLSKHFNEGDIVVSCNGVTALATFLMADLKKNQRLIANIGCGSMGYDLPAAIGACIGNKKRPVILTVGDGSIQFNIQELQTIITYNLPIKIFLFDNKGYMSIRNTQRGYFKNRFTASDNTTGVICPDMTKIARAYGIKTVKIANHRQLRSGIRKTLSMEGPVLCVLNIPETIDIIPKTGSFILPDGSMVSRPMEDLFPYLEREDFEKEMIIKPVTYEPNSPTRSTR